MSGHIPYDISIDRVEKLSSVPLLVVGLGGAGCDALRRIKETFSKQFVLPKGKNGAELSAPPRTSYLAIDTDHSSFVGFDRSEYVDIFMPDTDVILNRQGEMLLPHERTWVDRNLKSGPTLAGSGMIRQAARLALFRNYDKIYEAVLAAILSINAVNELNCLVPLDQIEIVVITSVSGGTGSGIFLDLCQILRRAAKCVDIPVSMTGYIMMPDIFTEKNPFVNPSVNDILLSNAYAALKELDFWMRVRDHQIPFSVQYGSSTTINWEEPPFDHCVLLSSSNMRNLPYQNGYKAVLDTLVSTLMHFMAEEVGTLGRQPYYHRIRGVLRAVNIQKSYPLHYGYQAIGAFTKQIPKRSILYYEGSLLLKTFVPMRDDSGKLQPDRRMFTDGQGRSRAESITGNGPQLMQDFRTNVCRLPGFCNLDLNDKVKVTAVQNMNPAPHNKWHTWRDTVSSPAALKAADSYLDKAWERFCRFAEEIIMDPEQGPFALEAYLDASDGLISYMSNILESWTNQYHKTRNQSIASGEEMCRNAWGAFCHPPVLGSKSALEQYDHAIKTLYTYVNNCEFLEKHTAALEKLILRVKEYLRDGLKPLCASIEFLEKEFNTQEQDDEVLVQDIYNLATVQQSIDEAFKEANANDKMSSEFLQKIAAIAVKTQPNVDAKTSGVEFLCRSVGLTEMCQVIQAGMEEVYGSVNNQSLDGLMIANVGEDVAAQQQWMDNLASSALDSALPMFMQDAVFKSQQVAAYSFIYIPQNSPEHLRYIHQAFMLHVPDVYPIASPFDDHIFVQITWEKLPLFHYGLFEKMRSAYDTVLRQHGNAGIHLVQNGDAGADYLNNWSRLPSPKPWFLFTRNSVRSEEREYEKVHWLVERGIKCGMIAVRDDLPFVQATVNVLYMGEAQMSRETIMAEHERLKNEKNPATGNFYTRKEIAAKLKAMLASSRKFVLEENEISLANVANVLGLEHEPCDPFDPAVKADIVKLRRAQKNCKRLYALMTEAMIYMRPDLVLALELQIDAFEAIHQEIVEIVGVELWKNRQAFSETAVEIFLFLNDRIFLGGDGYKYKENGNKYDIITPNLLAEDLKPMDSLLLKAACFLADAEPGQTAKADLLRGLETAKREYNNAIDEGEMTADTMNELMEAAKDLMADLENDAKNIRHAIHMNPGREDELAPQAEMAEAMQKVLESRNRMFRKIAKGLD